MNEVAILPDAVIRTSYLEQAQLMQVHRWLSACCSAPDDLQQVGASFAQLLADDAVISIDGAPVDLSRHAYPVIPHLVIAEVDASDAADGCRVRVDCLDLQVAGHHYRKGARLDVQFNQADVDLPLIKTVRITGAVGFSASPQYPQDDPRTTSRLLALKHRWHSLGERPQKNVAPYRQIVTDDFVMQWNTGSVTSFDELSAWLVTTTSRVTAARHDILSFSHESRGNGQYVAHFNFQWSGISTTGESMQATSAHRWLVTDQRSDLFARIKRMDVNLLVPFHVVG